MTQTIEPDKPDTLALWNAVSKTNPAFTKKVNQRGGFTAIAAHSQIMEATRQFGPVGIGWGYDTHEPIFRENLIIIPVTIWHGERRNGFGPLYGAAELVNDKGRVDHDAPKKATTDAITKGLSQLGFNADVFLGLFDDNKYVEQVRRDFAANDSQSAHTRDEGKGAKKPLPLEGYHKTRKALKDAYDQIVGELRGVADVDALKAYLADEEIDLTLRQMREIDYEKNPVLWDGYPEPDTELFPGMSREIANAFIRIEQEADGEELVNRMMAG